MPQYLTYQGVAQEIVEGTQTYETFGAGYLYQFYYTETVVNAKGAEVAVTHLLDATLTAGEVSVFYGTLYITGETDARQIQLNVVRTYDT